MVGKQRKENRDQILQAFCLFFGLVLSTSLSSAFGNEGLRQPVFNPRPRNVSFSVGETATLECSIRGLETRFVYWMKMSEPNPITVGEYVYSPDDRFSVQRRQELFEWNLKIKDVREEDAGVYFCAVSAGEKREKYRQMVLLRVKASQNRSFKMDTFGSSTIEDVVTSKPAISISGKNYVTKGDPIKLQCNATGSHYAPELLDWFKDGNRLTRRHTSHIMISDYNFIEKKTLISNLYIRKSRMTDAGVYMCRSTSLEIESTTVHVLDEEKRNPDKRGTAPIHSGTTLKRCNELCILAIIISLFSFVS